MKILYEYNGEKGTWGFWRENPPKSNINWRTIRTRISSQGMTFQEAIDKETRPQEFKISHDDLTLSKQQWIESDYCVVSQATVFKREKEGWNFIDAISTPAVKYGGIFKAFGKNLTLTEWTGQEECVAVSSSTIWSRLDSGMSIEDALSFPLLNMGRSKQEKDLSLFLRSNGIELIEGSRDIIKPKELDIYIPSKNIAIEFNGLFWHREDAKGKNYHYEKYLACKEKGIQLIQIWEDDWENKKDIVKKMLLHKLGISREEKIGARKCEIIILDSSTAYDFMEENHIQGGSPSSVHYALSYNDEVVSVISFKRDGDGWDLVRYATSKSVPGGFTRLLSNFRKDHTGPIKTFADLTISDGGLYYSNGFIEDKFLSPDYSYIHNHKRVHKFNYRKARFLKDPLLRYRENMTEAELARLNNLDRIYDAGKMRFMLD